MESKQPEKSNDFTLIDSRRALANAEHQAQRQRAKAPTERELRSNKSVMVAPPLAHQEFSLLGSLGNNMSSGKHAVRGGLSSMTGIPFGKVMPPPAEKEQAQRLSSSAPKSTTAVLSSKSRPAPSTLKVSTLNCPFKKAHAIVVNTNQQSRTQCIESARQAWKLCCDHLDALSPNVTYKPHSTKTKCKGSYTTPDLLRTTTFEAQMWEVASAISKQNDPMIILEFRTLSLEGRDAFRDLVRIVAGEMKTAGIAKSYANGIDIYTKEETGQDVEEDHGPLAIPVMGGLGIPSFKSASKRPTQQQKRKSRCPIELNPTQLNLWAKILKEQKFPICVDTLRLIAECCMDENNLKLLASRKEVLAAVCFELNSSVAPSACLNALTIASSVLNESHDAFTTMVQNGLPKALANSIKMHSGSAKVGSSRVVASMIIVQTALGVVDTLIKLSKGQEAANLQKTLKKLQSELSGNRNLNDRISERIHNLSKKVPVTGLVSPVC